MTSPAQPAAKTERDARRRESQRRSSQAAQAQTALSAAETALRECDERIDAHRTAIISHKRGLKTSKDERAGLVNVRKQSLKDVSRTNARAAKAEARYDAAVLAQLVDDAKDADRAHVNTRKTSAPGTRTVRATTTTPRKAVARTTAPRKSTRRTTPRSATAEKVSAARGATQPAP